MVVKVKKFFATTLAACMFFSMAACDQAGIMDSSDNNVVVASGYSYLAIDINPSMEIVVLDGVVVTVKACNEDAAILLAGEDFTDMSVEAAMQNIVELAEDLGYLTEENSNVKINVSADSETVLQTITECAKTGVEKGSDLAKVNHEPRSNDERKVKELQAEDPEMFKYLTPAKLRLIEAIMAYDETMTYEIGAQMKVSELADMLEDITEVYGDIVGEELETLFNKAWKGFEESVKGKIADCYGEEYKAAWERYVALEKVAREIEKKAENVSISEEDMQAIMDLLGVKDFGGIFGDKLDEDFEEDFVEDSDDGSDEDEIPEEESSWENFEDKIHWGYGQKLNAKGKYEGNGFGDGHDDWKVKDYDDYFDKNHHGKWEDDDFEELEEQIEAILEKYDEDNYVLTEEDHAAITAAWGELLEVETYGDLEDFLKAEKKNLDAMRKAKEQELREEEKAAIEIMEEASKQWKDKAFEGIKEQVNAAKEYWKAQKEEKKGHK